MRAAEGRRGTRKDTLEREDKIGPPRESAARFSAAIPDLTISRRGSNPSYLDDDDEDPRDDITNRVPKKKEDPKE